MRMRRKKHGAARLAALGDLVRYQPVADWQGKPPSELEIGCGKGGFITRLAAQNTKTQYAAMERLSDVILLAAEECARLKLNNITFINADATRLSEFFNDGQFHRIYINFPDPWPKKGHAKRRLTSPAFLETYKRLLYRDGIITFKTDNRSLFEYSLKQFIECGFNVTNITYDLHNDENKADNIITEYEALFMSKGLPIHRLQAFVKR